MLKDQFSKKISEALMKERPNIKKQIIEYIDKYSNVLYSAKFTENIYFSDDDRAVIFSSLNITQDEMEDAINKSDDINKQFKISSNSFYITTMLLIREAVLKKDKDTSMLASLYMSCMMYSSMHSQFLKYKGNEDIMDYTINNLDNNFKFKKLGTIYKLLEDNIETWITTYDGRIKKGNDSDLVYVLNALQTRIRGKVRKIFNEFYKNWKDGKYLFKSEIYTGEDEYKNSDNNSFIIQRLSDKVYLNLLQKGINDKLIKYSITKADVSFEKLKSIIMDLINADNKDDIRTLISSIIEYYVIYSGNDISYVSKGDFIVYMMKAYSSNTDASQIKEAKELIEKWISSNATKYGMKRYGKTAMQAYRKSLFMFVVYTINMNSKGS